MIYGQEKEPVGEASLLVNGEPGPTSDREGRFVFPDLKRGDHVVTVSKSGCEPTEVRFQFLNQTQVLYLPIRSVDDIDLAAELELRESRFAQAEEILIAFVEDGTSEPEVCLALADLYEYGLGDAERAAAQLRIVLRQRPADELHKRLYPL